MDNIKAYIYIHVPKTGGNFINGIINKSIKSSKIVYFDKFCKHKSIKFILRHFEKSNRPEVGFVGIVRNPFDRVYSLWKYLIKETSYVDIHLHVPKTFKDFIEELNCGEYDRHFFLKPQNEYFECNEDKVIKILKFEDMNTEVKDFFEKNGVEWSYEKVNATPGPHYTKVYTPQMSDVVRRKYELEFETFGYSLDL